MQIVQLFMDNGMIHTGRLLEGTTFEQFEADLFDGGLNSVTVETKLLRQDDGASAWVAMAIRADKVTAIVQMPGDTMLQAVDEGGNKIAQFPSAQEHSQEDHGDVQDTPQTVG